jgi:type II secretory pathway pseudopilin PulG
MYLGQGSGADISGLSGAAPGDRGYAMAALLVGLSIMAVLMSAALPVWAHFSKREKEEELIWRGQQYARAIGLFQRKYANTFPPSVDLLVEQKFLRKKYKDPITNDDFQPIPAGGVAMPIGGGGQQPLPPGAQPSAGGSFFTPTGPQQGIGGGITGAPAAGNPFQPSIGIQGVVSKSKDASIKVFNGRTRHNEWMFVYLASAQRIGPGGVPVMPGQQQPGAMPRPGFSPPSGLDRRPGIGPGMQPGADPRQPGPFGQPPSGQPPFGQPPFRPSGGPPPTRPPGG